MMEVRRVGQLLLLGVVHPMNRFLLFEQLIAELVRVKVQNVLLLTDPVLVAWVGALLLSERLLPELLEVVL
jgi:hypothetical protein